MGLLGIEVDLLIFIKKIAFYHY